MVREAEEEANVEQVTCEEALEEQDGSSYKDSDEEGAEQGRDQ
jgi:hypothetical protein